MPKNIVLLSDGTGNSEASPFKTNVWRLYQALDISRPNDNEPAQIAYYNNGVGTETFKPLAMLGLALGVGVATNVKTLYTFLRRNYCEGDRIYLFGFSRGAFTVRLLAGLIVRCGLVTAPTDPSSSSASRPCTPNTSGTSHAVRCRPIAHFSSAGFFARLERSGSTSPACIRKLISWVSGTRVGCLWNAR